MTKLRNSLSSWNTAVFADTLRNEISELDQGTLPLQQCTTQGGLVDDSALSISLISCSENEKSVITKIGVFFTEVVGGCNCNDDPVHSHSYCELIVSIDKSTAYTDFQTIPD